MVNLQPPTLLGVGELVFVVSLDPFVCGIVSIAQQNWNVAPCMSNAVKGQDQVDSMKSGHENDAPNLSGKWLTAYVVSQ